MYFFRNRFGCKHFLLAIDELLHLDSSSEGIKSSRIQGFIKAIAKTVTPTDGIHTIFSSLVTNPFEEFIRGSQYTPHYVRLPPFLDNLDHLSKLLAKKRNDESTKLPIWQLLLSTGGHPKLTMQLIPWLLTVRKNEMSFVKAAGYGGLKISKIQGFSEHLRRLIFTCGWNLSLERRWCYLWLEWNAIPPIEL